MGLQLKPESEFIHNGKNRPNAYARIVTFPENNRTKKYLQMLIGVYEDKDTSDLSKTDETVNPMKWFNVKIADKEATDESPEETFYTDYIKTTEDKPQDETLDNFFTAKSYQAIKEKGDEQLDMTRWDDVL
jgi:hypothetical protein